MEIAQVRAIVAAVTSDGVCHRVVGLLLGVGLVIAAARAADTDKPAATPRKDPSKHWAFRPPARPAEPAVRNKVWIRTPVDRFVLARLDKEGLKPSLEADRATLLRRLSLDLIGLPPTPDEIDAFVRDRGDGAYERQVDRLLKSPHYGERWARVWLDVARYADSDGFEKDKARFIWAYRDWVVGAFNRDLGYDRFITEQIAGDLLPNATEDNRIATGFLRNAMLNEEGGVDPEQFRTDGLIDRMDCLGKSILGLTIQCGQCHDHKYDPFTQRDYYRLFAFINNDHESSMVAYTPEQEMLRGNVIRQIRDMEEGLRHATANWRERMDQWEDSVRNNQPEWQYLDAVHAGENGERFYYYEDHSIRAASYAPTLWTAHFEATNRLASIGAFRLEQLTDPNLPCGGPGRSIKGMAALSEFRVEAVDIANPTNKVNVRFVKATADFANAEKDLEPEFDNRDPKRRPYGPVEFAIDGKDDTAWGIDAGPGRRNVARKAVFIPEKPIQFPQGAKLNIFLVQNHGGYNSDDNMNHNLGRFRLSVSSDSNAVADPLPANVREIFAIPRDQRSPAQIAAVFTHWRTTVPEFKEVNDKIEALWRQYPEGEPTLTLVARKGAGVNETDRQTHIFKRGDWLKPTDAVTYATPAFLNPAPEGADGSRLTLARWLTDRRAPTTARVFVNRVWQAYFGVGIVDTPEDFGMQGAAPSHPELLDWLACEFMDHGWSVKHLQRLIVNSATYRQSSRVSPELLERDRYNRLLARGPRLRVDAEIVRDIQLSVSGLLDPRMGGPSVKPPAPAFLFLPPASYGPKPWPENPTAAERRRRGLYTFRYRSSPYPFLTVFDAPNGDFSCVRRTRSNTPLQALMTLNETVSMECARGLAAKVLADGGKTDEDRLAYAFRRVVSRAPDAVELKTLKEFLDRQHTHFADGWANPAELATIDGSTSGVPKGATPTQLAAYTAVSRVILNLDEAITKE
jgi:Protein of unknown function (DUF1553)/Protein of unknown function (DUF1549)